MDSLTALYDKVVPGGFVIVDDYGAIPACKQAITDFREQRNIQDEIYNIDNLGVFWQKTC
jgi:O-methyltransferase